MMAPGQGSQSALAAVDTTSQLRWTSDDANLFKTQYEGLGILQARSQGNLFIKYFRKLLTLRDGAPLVSEVDISLVENCKIIGFALAGEGQFGTFQLESLAYQGLIGPPARRGDVVANHICQAQTIADPSGDKSSSRSPSLFKVG